MDIAEILKDTSASIEQEKLSTTKEDLSTTVQEAEGLTTAAATATISTTTTSTTENIGVSTNVEEKDDLSTTTISTSASDSTINGSIDEQPELGTATSLIHLVQPHPELYDKTHRFFNNNVHKGIIWQKITEQLGGTSAKKTREQWSYIRKRFRTEYEIRKTGIQKALIPEPDSANYRPPLYLYEQLAFLEEFFEKEIAAAAALENDNNETKEKIEKIESGLDSPLKDAPKASGENGEKIPKKELPITGNSTPKTPSPRKRKKNENIPEVSPKSEKKNENSSPKSSTSFTTLSSASNAAVPINPVQLAAFLSNYMKTSQPPQSHFVQDFKPEDEECQLFGRQVALDLQKLDSQTRIRVRHEITKILMELYLKQCENESKK